MLQTSILHAKIVSDGGDDEMAEIEAVLEEAAELVDDSEPKKPNYYRFPNTSIINPLSITGMTFEEQII